MEVRSILLVMHLCCQTIVLRAILKKTWMDDSLKITSSAFMYDPSKDPDGLSVNVQADTNTDEWLGSFNKSFGADSIHCGSVRNIGIEIGQTQEDINSGSAHAVIVGLPSQDEDPQAAEDFAGKLVSLSRRLDRTRRSKREHRG